jgi:hypothetical protein
MLQEGGGEEGGGGRGPSCTIYSLSINVFKIGDTMR